MMMPMREGRIIAASARIEVAFGVVASSIRRADSPCDCLYSTMVIMKGDEQRAATLGRQEPSAKCGPR